MQKQIILLTHNFSRISNEPYNREPVDTAECDIQCEIINLAMVNQS